MKYLITLIIIPTLLSINLFSQNAKYGIVIHGGAGSIVKGNISPEMEKKYEEKMREALLAGNEVLKNNGTSLDAVVAAIKILEDSPLFNAGKGAVFNSKGKNDLDASIMDGKTQNAGAVAGVMHIKNPITLARLVMEKTEHVLLAGEGAEEFAVTQGIEIVPEEYFYDENRWKDLQRAKEKERADSLKQRGDINIDIKFGTVGAVALDKHGNLAAGTSTGGRTNKKFGRVGDSPIIGAGTYASNKTCAVSSTGWGEYFIRSVGAYDVSARMEYKALSVKEAAEQSVKKIGELGGDGGFIAIDKDGNIAAPFNTTGMFRAYMEDGEAVVKMYRE